VGEGYLNEQFPLRNVDSSKLFIKKGNQEQLGLGKLRHKGVKINFLVLYGMSVVETVTEQKLLQPPAGYFIHGTSPPFQEKEVTFQSNYSENTPSPSVL